MNFRCLLMVVAALALAVFPADADTKIVKLARTDAVAVMGDSGHAAETRTVFWVGNERLRMDAGDLSIIVLGKSKRMIVVDKAAGEHSILELPVDPGALLPEGVASETLRSFEYQVTVEATDEWATKGHWKARRYDVTFFSSMARVESQVWATTDVDLDVDGFRKLYSHILLLQPGMAQAVSKLATIEGLEVANEAMVTVTATGGGPMVSSEQTQSIETTEAPAGTYEPPKESKEKAFDVAMLTGG